VGGPGGNLKFGPPRFELRTHTGGQGDRRREMQMSRDRDFDPYDRPGDRRWSEEPRDLSAALAHAEEALMTGTDVPFDGPPPEVQREMAAAERAWRNLEAQGRELRFGTGLDGRVSVELTDTAGRAVDQIGPVGLFRLLKLAS
jgi:hypothetical protein